MELLKYILAVAIGAFVAGISAVAWIDARIEKQVTVTLNNPGTKLPVGTTGPEGVSVPVGGVVAYSGPVDGANGTFNLPPEVTRHFELCDGERVTMPGSPINGRRKPKLMGRFVRGAVPEELSSFSAGPEPKFPVGGSDTLKLAHTHAAGSLGVMMAPSGGWWHYTKRSGPNLRLESGMGNAGQDRPTGDLVTQTRIAIDGETAAGLGEEDNRPAFVSLIYLIRVK